MERITVILLAAGAGTRIGGDIPKQFLTLGGKTLLMHCYETFKKELPEAYFVLVLPADYVEKANKLLIERGRTNAVTICEGGETRFHSVKRALSNAPQCDYIMIHDAARPLVSSELIRRTLQAARVSGSAIPCARPSDSVRMIKEEGSVPVDRSSLRAVQTPQVFRESWLQEAYRQEYAEHFTDDATVIETLGVSVTLVDGDPSNIKVTNPDDLIIAQALLESKEID